MERIQTMSFPPNGIPYEFGYLIGRGKWLGCQLLDWINAPSNPSSAEFAEKTIDYAVAKTALRAEMPELMKIATGKEEP